MALVALARADDARFTTWDRLYLKPELPLPIVAERGELTLLLYHSYPVPLHHLRLAAAPGSELAATPIELPELPPTLIRPAKLILRPTPQASGDQARLRLELSADELAKPHAYELSIPLTPAGEAAAELATSLPVGEVAIVVTRHSRLIDAVEIAVVVLLLAWVVRRRIQVG